MFTIVRNGLPFIIYAIFTLNKCSCELLPTQSTLLLFSPGELEYTEVLVRREHDNLTLVCELRGDKRPHRFVWNYLPDKEGSEDEQSKYRVEPPGLAHSSKLVKEDLQLADSGQYICSSPPYSVTKYILVQTKGPKHCARASFWCGDRCVLPMYVCDGLADCVAGEDEAPSLCQTERPCHSVAKLNCSSGRCVPEAACCRPHTPLCTQPRCCDEHARYSTHEGYMEMEYPMHFEDRHAPDDYGFIQSTIYTVTACALIFMIAVVLLVSAICKMHMKRAALRSIAARRTNNQLYQSGRFPPCYEASRLLEEQRRAPTDTEPAPNPDCPDSEPSECAEQTADEPRTGLARLGAIFSSRYRQVPTQCSEVEMTDVRCSSANNSPTRNRTLNNYRSPTYCDLNSTDFYFTNPDTPDLGRDLNYMEIFPARNSARGHVERLLDQLGNPRPITLQVGRFQLSIPRFGRNPDSGRRPDTPNVAEISIEDLDFVRLNSNETYTLNGRTIRLLGANFENYPNLNENSSRPPPYNEAMRYKLYGPPPEYLSRDNLNNERPNNVTNNVDEEARSNVEMPPRYEDLASGASGENNGNVTNNDNVIIAGTNIIRNDVINNGNVAQNVINNDNTTNNDTVIGNVITPLPTTSTACALTERNGNVITDNNVKLTEVINNLPAIDSDVNANESASVVDNNKAVAVSE